MRGEALAQERVEAAGGQGDTHNRACQGSRRGVSCAQGGETMRSGVMAVAVAMACVVLLVGCGQGGSDRESGEVAGEPVKVTSRYAEAEGVRIDPARVPEELRSLIPLAKQWAIGDDVERDRYERSVSREERKAFVETVGPKMKTVEAFCAKHRDEIPVPDEVVLFDMMSETYEELWPEFER